MERKILLRLLTLLSAILFFVHTATAQTPAITYPRITGYVAILHPIVTFGNGGAHVNFNGAYTAGLPTGINIWKSPTIGFSMEIVPFIRAADGTSKMNNLLIHPGLLLGLGKGFTLINRAAFETNGRYGITTVINKVIVKKKDHSYFISMPIPARFGNDHPSTIGIGLQFGISF
ncbi:hypothetical protein [Chitinophaga tropicalis]|uniref:Uncharacterized protein n=1 Tax=Chitinophaga tropicalis TaxID=2683588 RepID=A0A7K1U3I7_9BACT|nr:hypothetical protein [Chitinophaga tropicalis]MVT08565.1 hypothetical protein [Chitinophaga tropicalis]